MLVQFVVSLEVNFCRKNRAYFDTILYGGRLADIRAAKEDMERVLYRELAHMMELQIVVTLAAVMFLGNVLSLLGLDAEMTNIFRILCFGYCIYGLFKCLTIILLYFDDRKGACVSAALFAIFSVLLTALTLKAGDIYLGDGISGGRRGRLGLRASALEVVSEKPGIPRILPAAALFRTGGRRLPSA